MRKSYLTAAVFSALGIVGMAMPASAGVDLTCEPAFQPTPHGRGVVLICTASPGGERPTQPLPPAPDQGLPEPPPTPDQGLPPGGGSPDQGLPPGGGSPDQGLPPGGQAPDQGLPPSGGAPDQDLPPGGYVPPAGGGGGTGGGGEFTISGVVTLVPSGVAAPVTG